jgi:hypothetical protein
MKDWLFLICLALALWALAHLFSMIESYYHAKVSKVRKKQEDLDKAQKEFDYQQNIKQIEIENEQKRNKEDHEAVLKLAEEKGKGFPWLAEAFSQYFYLRHIELAGEMETKPHPALTSAERVREIGRDRRVVESKFRIAQGVIKYYQNLFPFLEDFLGDIEDEILKQVLAKNITTPIQEINEAGIDPVRAYLASISEEEYRKLSSCQRNQLALDRFWTKTNKSKWQIGRDYERFIGYIYEINGYGVYYQGILEGYDDLGRDLIAKTKDKTIIIQCKRWSQHKKIHEKHINQLFGTVIKYKIDNPHENVNAALITTTILSDRAKEFAAHLGVDIAENYEFKLYPSIKCNISRKTGEKIYHLPFDQQYDKVIIEEEKYECYAATVQEAENLGYRRAWKWLGNAKDGFAK